MYINRFVQEKRTKQKEISTTMFFYNSTADVSHKLHRLKIEEKIKVTPTSPPIRSHYSIATHPPHTHTHCVFFCNSSFLTVKMWIFKLRFLKLEYLRFIKHQILRNLNIKKLKADLFRSPWEADFPNSSKFKIPFFCKQVKMLQTHWKKYKTWSFYETGV